MAGLVDPAAVPEIIGLNGLAGLATGLARKAGVYATAGLAGLGKYIISPEAELGGRRLITSGWQTEATLRHVRNLHPGMVGVPVGVQLRSWEIRTLVAARRYTANFTSAESTRLLHL